MPRSFNTPASNGSLSGSVTNQWVHEGWRITSSTSPPALIMLNVFDSWYCNYPFRSLQLWKHEWQWCFFFLFFVLALNVPVLLSCCAVKYVWRWHCVRNGKKHWRKTIIRTDRAERMQIWSRTDKQHKHMHTHTHLCVWWFSTVSDIKGRILCGCCPSEWKRKCFFWSHYLCWQTH